MGDFQSVLLQHTRLQVKLKEVLWLSEFAVNERQVRGGGGGVGMDARTHTGCRRGAYHSRGPQQPVRGGESQQPVSQGQFCVSVHCSIPSVCCGPALVGACCGLITCSSEVWQSRRSSCEGQSFRLLCMLSMLCGTT